MKSDTSIIARRISLISIAFILTACCIMLSGCSLFPKEEVFETTALVKEEEEPEFSMTTVKRGDICEYNKIDCEYSESNTQIVSLDEWVVIEEVNVDVGDAVCEGDVLVTVKMEDDKQNEADECRYNIKVKKEMIKRCDALEELEIKKQRLIMDDETAIRAIRERYDVERSGYESELEILELELEEYKNEMDQYKIKADFDGVVTFANKTAATWRERKRSFGRSESGGKKIVAISDGSQPRFTAAYATLRNKTSLKDGDRVTVVSGKEEYETTVETDEDFIYFMLDHIPDNMPGDVAYAKEVKEEKKDVLYLPKSAVSKLGDKDVVYREDENGLKSPVEVEVGLIAQSKAEIISGLEEGDAVIVR